MLATALPRTSVHQQQKIASLLHEDVLFSSSQTMGCALAVLHAVSQLAHTSEDSAISDLNRTRTHAEDCYQNFAAGVADVSTQAVRHCQLLLKPARGTHGGTYSVPLDELVCLLGLIAAAVRLRSLSPALSQTQVLSISLPSRSRLHC